MIQSHGVTEAVHTFVNQDGCRLRYRVWSGRQPVSATIVVLNGLMSHSGWFRDVATLIAGFGVKVVGADRRGSGSNKDNRGVATSRHALLSDLRTIMQQEDSGVPVYLAGWCWGAVLAVIAALEFRTHIHGLILLAPGLFPSEIVRARVNTPPGALNDAIAHLPTLRSPITEEIFSDSPAIQAFIRNDALAVRMFSVNFFRIAAEMSLIAATRLRDLVQPTFLLLAENDQAVDNTRTLSAFKRIRGLELTTATINGNHAMQLECPQEIAAHILGWLQSQSVQQRRSLGDKESDGR